MQSWDLLLRLQYYCSGVAGRFWSYLQHHATSNWVKGHRPKVHHNAKENSSPHYCWQCQHHTWKWWQKSRKQHLLHICIWNQLTSVAANICQLSKSHLSQGDATRGISKILAEASQKTTTLMDFHGRQFLRCISARGNSFRTYSTNFNT